MQAKPSAKHQTIERSSSPPDLVAFRAYKYAVGLAFYSRRKNMHFLLPYYFEERTRAMEEAAQVFLDDAELRQAWEDVGGVMDRFASDNPSPSTFEALSRYVAAISKHVPSTCILRLREHPLIDLPMVMMLLAQESTKGMDPMETLTHGLTSPPFSFLDSLKDFPIEIEDQAALIEHEIESRQRLEEAERGPKIALSSAGETTVTFSANFRNCWFDKGSEEQKFFHLSKGQARFVKFIYDNRSKRPEGYSNEELRQRFKKSRNWSMKNAFRYAKEEVLGLLFDVNTQNGTWYAIKKNLIINVEK